MIGIYSPGHSILHRTPTGAKLLLLLTFTSALLIFRSITTMGIAAVVLLVAYVLARIPLRLAMTQLKPLRWILPILFAFQWWLLGIESATLITSTLLLAVAAAALITLTTPVSAMMATLERMMRPGQRWGLPAERIALVLALTIRVVPVIADIVNQVRDARRARGAERSMRALVTPVVIKTVGHAHELGDALIARGLDD